MDENEQAIIEAAVRYLDALQRGELPHLERFAESAAPGLRAEVRAYLEELVLADDPFDQGVLTEDENAFAARMAALDLSALRTRLETSGSRTLTEARKARRLSGRKLARQINLPIALLDRLERGGILLTTVPEQLTARLAAVLDQTESEVFSLLRASQLASQARQLNYLSAKDGTMIEEIGPLSFEDALELSQPTVEQRREWGKPASQ
jgi:transcriptional regulator with XRE-family HTH domain